MYMSITRLFNKAMFLNFCFGTDDNRIYGYARFDTEDEMSRRAKFAFITWIGTEVPPLRKATVSSDKVFVKEICTVRPCLHGAGITLLEGSTHSFAFRARVSLGLDFLKVLRTFALSGLVTSRLGCTLRALPRALCARFLFLPD